jgi:hypothetical protein
MDKGDNVMRIRFCAMAAIVLCLVPVPSFSADITGVWVAELSGMGGQAVKTTFNLKAEGATLTGTMSGPGGSNNPISEGRINGDKVSFAVKITANQNEMKIVYSGAVAGNEMRLKVEFEGGMSDGPGAGTMEIVAKKQ